MSQQSLVVAAIVVVTFAGGFLTGRMSVPVASAPPAPVVAMAPAQAPSPFPMAGAPAAAPEGHPAIALSGQIAEVIQVPSFTYLRITTSSGEQWAAISANETLAVGQSVKLGQANLMENFASKTLGRTFEKIWFGELAQ